MRRRWFRFGRLSRIAALVAAALAVPAAAQAGHARGGIVAAPAPAVAHPVATPRPVPVRGAAGGTFGRGRFGQNGFGQHGFGQQSFGQNNFDGRGPGFRERGRYAYGGYGLDGFGLAGFGLDSGFPPAPAPAVDGGPGADDPVIPAPRTCIPPLIIKIGPGPRHPPTTRVVYGPPVCGG